MTVDLHGFDSLITRSRNTLVARFMDRPTATHLLFVDADITYLPSQVIRMIAFGQDVVAGMYPLKTHDWSPEAITRVRQGEGLGTAALRYVGLPCAEDVRAEKDGFVTGEYAGTGFMMITARGSRAHDGGLSASCVSPRRMTARRRIRARTSLRCSIA